MNAAENVHIPRKARKAERNARKAVPPWVVTEVQKCVETIRVDRLVPPLLLSIMGPPSGRSPRNALGAYRPGERNPPDRRRPHPDGESDRGGEGHQVNGERKSTPRPVLVATALRWFKAIRAAERPVQGADYVDSGRMAVNETGAVLTAGQLRTRAYLLMTLALPRRVRLYDARASCSTYLADNAVLDHILAEWAGHTHNKATKGWSVKPDVEDLRGVAQTLGGLVTAEGGVREEL